MSIAIDESGVMNPEGIGGKSGKIVRDQFDPQQKTAERLADEYERAQHTGLAMALQN